MNKPRDPRVMVRETSSFIAAICVAVSPALFSGCGPADEPEAVTDAEYFGLVSGRCLGLRGGPSDLQQITVEVGGTHVIGELEVTEVGYRINGVLRRVEYVSLANGELRVVRREDPGTASADSEYEPPYLLSKRPLNATFDGPLRTTTTAHSVFGSSESLDWEIEVSIESPVSVDVPGSEDMVQTFAHFVNLTSNRGGEIRVDRFSIAPGIGFTHLDLHGDLPSARLVAIWTSDGPCGEIPLD